MKRSNTQVPEVGNSFNFSPNLPGQWKVEGNTGTQIGLFVCGDTITSVNQYKLGDLDEFASIVRRLSISHGKPDTQVVTFMSGATRVSNVDSRFAEFAGLKATVQLSSIAGRLGISANYFMGGECKKP